MPLTKEERAEINRRNAAKSTGPKTIAGKMRSRLNAIKHARYVQEKDLMCPPHSSVLLHEDRREFFVILHQLRRIFAPANGVEADIVNDMADARWAINRAKRIETGIHNRAIYQQCKLLNEHAGQYDEDIINLEVELRAAESIASNPGVRDARRQVRQLSRLLAQLEKRLADLRKNFASSNTHELHDNEEQLDRELAVLDMSDFKDEEEQQDANQGQVPEPEEDQHQETAIVPATETLALPPQQPDRSHLSVANKEEEAPFRTSQRQEYPGPQSA